MTHRHDIPNPKQTETSQIKTTIGIILLIIYIIINSTSLDKHRRTIFLIITIVPIVVWLITKLLIKTTSDTTYTMTNSNKPKKDPPEGTQRAIIIIGLLMCFIIGSDYGLETYIILSIANIGIAISSEKILLTLFMYLISFFEIRLCSPGNSIGAAAGAILLFIIWCVSILIPFILLIIKQAIKGTVKRTKTIIECTHEYMSRRKENELSNPSKFMEKNKITPLNISKVLQNRGTPLKLSPSQKEKYPIILQFSAPKGINSAEAGVLFNGKAESEDMLSLLYQWANDGFIKIKNNENITNGESNANEIIIEKIHPLTPDHPTYETHFFNSFFRTQSIIKINKSNFYLPPDYLLPLEIYCIKKGWLKDNSEKIFKIYLIISTIIFIVGLIKFLGTVYFNNKPSAWILMLTLLFIIIYVGGILSKNKKLKLTDEGAKILSHLIGYKKFIDTCDQTMIKTLLKKDPLFINKSLPYAIAFGSDTKILNIIKQKEIDLFSQNGRHISTHVSKNEIEQINQHFPS